MDVFSLIWFLTVHGVNTAMCLAVTRVGAGWAKTLLGLLVFYAAIAATVAFSRFENFDPKSFTPFAFPIGFGVWLVVTLVLSRRRTVPVAFFEAVLCGAHQLAVSGLCYVLMARVRPEGLGKVLASVLLLAMGAFMIGLLLPRIRHLSRSVDWLILNVTASVLLVLIYSTCIWPIWLASGSWRGAVPFAVAVLTLVLFFPVVFHISERSRAAARLKQVENNTHLLMAELRNVRASEEGARRVRHDARHHLSVVRELLAAGRVAETDEYLANLSEHELLGSFGVKRWCENLHVDALLAVAYRKAAACGRRLVATADVPAALALDESDLVAVVGNLLENAVSHGAEGEIRVSAQLDGGHVLRLSVTNAVPAGFKLTNGLPAEAEGVGLASVRQVVEKHHGVMGYSVVEGELTCKVAIECVSGIP